MDREIDRQYTSNNWRILLNNITIKRVLKRKCNCTYNTKFLCATHVTSTTKQFFLLHTSFFPAFSFSPSLLVTKANLALSQIPDPPFNMCIWGAMFYVRSAVHCTIEAPHTTLVPLRDRLLEMGRLQENTATRRLSVGFPSCRLRSFCYM
jgi:hypothetical protein